MCVHSRGELKKEKTRKQRFMFAVAWKARFLSLLLPGHSPHCLALSPSALSQWALMGWVYAHENPKKEKRNHYTYVPLQ